MQNFENKCGATICKDLKGVETGIPPVSYTHLDNADPVKLLALDMKTGEIVASMPVLDLSLIHI